LDKRGIGDVWKGFLNLEVLGVDGVPFGFERLTGCLVWKIVSRSSKSDSESSSSSSELLTTQPGALLDGNSLAGDIGISNWRPSYPTGLVGGGDKLEVKLCWDEAVAGLGGSTALSIELALEAVKDGCGGFDVALCWLEGVADLEAGKTGLKKESKLPWVFLVVLDCDIFRGMFSSTVHKTMDSRSRVRYSSICDAGSGKREINVLGTCNATYRVKHVGGTISQQISAASGGVGFIFLEPNFSGRETLDDAQRNSFPCSFHPNVVSGTYASSRISYYETRTGLRKGSLHSLKRAFHWHPDQLPNKTESFTVLFFSCAVCTVMEGPLYCPAFSDIR
jgi:hypothetical protein